MRVVRSSRLLRCAQWGTAAFVAAMWAAFVEVSSHERSQIVEVAHRQVNNVGLLAEQHIQQRLLVASAVTRLMTLEQAPDPERTQRLLRGLAERNTSLYELAVLDARGRVTLSSNRSSLLVGGTIALPPLSGEGPGGVVLGPMEVDGRRVMPVLRPFYEGGQEPAGWVAVLFDADRLFAPLSAVTSHGKLLVTLLRQDGQAMLSWSNDGSSIDGKVLDLPGVALADALREAYPLGGVARFVHLRQVEGFRLSVVAALAAGDVMRPHEQRRWFYFGAMLLVTVLATLLVVALTRSLRRRIAAHQDLLQAQRELAEANERLASEVDRRTRELRLAVDDVESFSYSVAHDLRAPLSAIAGFGAALESTLPPDAPPKARHYLERIRAAGAHAVDITEGLLSLASLGRQPPELVPVDLGRIARDVLAALHEREPREVRVDIHGALLVRGAPTLLRQVMENLLGNAWKFLRDTPDPWIEIGAKASDVPGECTIYVRDNGPGFPMEYAAKLFRPFQRLHGKDFPGTGIGLATVKRIVELHGGRIRAESAEGRGATFLVTLPAVD